MLIPTIPGWKVEAIGDDIAWMKFGADGRLYAINPEYGFFGVAPGTSMKSNPNAMLTATKNAIFTNCAMTPMATLVGADDGGKARGIDRLVATAMDPGLVSQSGSSQFALYRSGQPVPGNCAGVGRSKGVPIDAILSAAVEQASSRWSPNRSIGSTAHFWERSQQRNHGGYHRKSRPVRRDPMAMLPFCGYHMGDYSRTGSRSESRRGEAAEDFLRELVSQGQERQVPVARIRRKQPRVEMDLRALRRQSACQGHSDRTDPRGRRSGHRGLDIKGAHVEELLSVDIEGWLAEVPLIREHFAQFGSHLPEGLNREVKALEERLQVAKR